MTSGVPCPIVSGMSHRIGINIRLTDDELQALRNAQVAHVRRGERSSVAEVFRAALVRYAATLDAEEGAA